MKTETIEEIAKRLGKQERAIDVPSPVVRALRSILTKKAKKKNSGQR
jgi:hypothetical protein